jgi:hypothetical protein
MQTILKSKLDKFCNLLPPFLTLLRLRVFSCIAALSTNTGGGRKIIRVEVSLDGGHLWTQAEITRHETPTPAGESSNGQTHVQLVEPSLTDATVLHTWLGSADTAGVPSLPVQQF